IFRGLGDRDGMAKCLWGWGACAQVANMHQEARPRLEEALEILAGSENTFQVGWASWVMANVLFKLGEADASRPHLAAALRVFSDAGDVSGMILVLTSYTRLFLMEGDTERVIVLIGVLGALKQMSGMDLSEAFSEEIEGLDRIFEEIDSERGEELLRIGRDMSRDQVIEYASTL
ncbi:MAG: tetratricopeptide repeat protein, partial [Acidimicrobiia bacterium]